MSLRISSVLLVAATLASVAGCSSEQPDNEVLAKVEAEQVRDAAAAGRIPCALGGAERFRIDCTMDRIASADGETLVLGRPDAGFRRFRVVTDGRGVIAADGAEPATVRIVEDGMIEVTVAQDRYRLPATLRGE
jgi:type IV pilus biogenesis protein CpaD/CtpE